MTYDVTNLQAYALQGEGALMWVNAARAFESAECGGYRLILVAPLSNDWCV